MLCVRFVFFSYNFKRMTHPMGWMIVLPTNDAFTMEYEHGYMITNITFKGEVYDMKVCLLFKLLYFSTVCHSVNFL